MYECPTFRVEIPHLIFKSTVFIPQNYHLITKERGGHINFSNKNLQIHSLYTSEISFDNKERGGHINFSNKNLQIHSLYTSEISFDNKGRGGHINFSNNFFLS